MANHAAAETFGYSDEEFTALNISALFHCIEQDLGKTAASRDFKIETKGLTKSGLSLDFELATEMVTINNLNYFLVIANDITMHKKTEELLILAKERSEHANKLKQEFLATINHELRTPLNGILGMLQLMEDTPLNQEQQEYLVTALTSGENLLHIINQTLNFSKIEAGKQVMQAVPFNLKDAILFLQDIFKQKLVSKCLQFSHRIAPDVPIKLIGDHMLLRQILMNLVGNAIKFTEQGEIQVQVQSQPMNNRQVKLLFCVTDTGVGIPKEKIDDVMTPFSQAEGSLQRKHEGTGLGLSIVSKLVEIMGGEVYIESTEGVGTKVDISAIFQIEDTASRHVANQLRA